MKTSLISIISGTQQVTHVEQKILGEKRYGLSSLPPLNRKTAAIAVAAFFLLSLVFGCYLYVKDYLVDCWKQKKFNQMKKDEPIWEFKPP